jgi:hypothetical protein
MTDESKDAGSPAAGATDSPSLPAVVGRAAFQAELVTPTPSAPTGVPSPSGRAWRLDALTTSPLGLIASPDRQPKARSCTPNAPSAMRYGRVAGESRPRLPDRRRCRYAEGLWMTASR